MIDQIQKYIGRRVVVDYVSSDETIFYAKGTLDDVDEHSSMILISSEDDDKRWFLAIQSVRNLVVKNGESELE